MKKNIVFFVKTFLSLIFLVGCSSTPKIDWDQRIGSYTYDQAVTDYGPPERSTELSTGDRVAEWERRGDSGSNISFGIGTGFFSRRSSFGVGTTLSPRSRTQILRLIFSPSGVLKGWKAERD